MNTEKEFIKIFGRAFRRTAKKYSCKQEEIQIVLKRNEGNHKKVLAYVLLNRKMTQKDVELSGILNFSDSALITALGLEKNISSVIEKIASENGVEPNDARVFISIEEDGEFYFDLYNKSQPVLDENEEVKSFTIDEISVLF